MPSRQQTLQRLGQIEGLAVLATGSQHQRRPAGLGPNPPETVEQAQRGGQDIELTVSGDRATAIGPQVPTPERGARRTRPTIAPHPQRPGRQPSVPGGGDELEQQGRGPLVFGKATRLEPLVVDPHGFGSLRGPIGFWHMI